jgi:biotin transport system substrate-specific component
MKKNMEIAKTLVQTDNKFLTTVFWTSTFTLLTAVAAQIEIPFQPVPFTLQTLFVLLAGAMLGARRGMMSMVSYLALGVIGLPVFAGGALGFAKLIGPTGGYLLSFPIAAFLVGYMSRRRTDYWWMVVTMVAGSVVIFALGTIQLNLVYFHDWAHSISAGFLIFSVWDIVKITAASTIAFYYRRMDHSL